MKKAIPGMIVTIAVLLIGKFLIVPYAVKSALDSRHLTSESPIVVSLDFEKEFEKWSTSGPHTSKGTMKMGTDQIPVEGVTYPDKTGTLTYHLADGTLLEIKMAWELKDHNVVVHYTNPATGETWDHTWTIQEWMRGQSGQ